MAVSTLMVVFIAMLTHSIVHSTTTSSPPLHNEQGGSNSTARPNNNTGILNISIEFVEKDNINVSWIIHKPVNASLSNFVVGYSILGQDKNGSNPQVTGLNIEFRSPDLGPATRSFVFHLPISRDLRICVYAKSGQGHEVRECSDVSNEHGDDDDEDDTIDTRKMASGIAAGCVFLIPCAVLLVYILRKDKQMRMSLYEGLEEAEQLNPAFSLMDEQKKLPAAGSLKGAKGGRLEGTDKDWKTLSVHGIVQVKKENGPTIYIHTNEEGVEEEEANSYSVRL